MINTLHHMTQNCSCHVIHACNAVLFHFGSSHFCSTRHCSRVFVCCSLVLLCNCQARQSMGRNRKWVLENSVSEAVWRTILRGPCPPATAWSRASKSVAKSPAQKFPSPAPKKGKARVNRGLHSRSRDSQSVHHHICAMPASLRRKRQQTQSRRSRG